MTPISNDPIASLPFSRFDQFANFALDQVAFERADVADVELAVEVIGLVLKGAGQQIVAGLLENLPGQILGADGHNLGATSHSRGNQEC